VPWDNSPEKRARDAAFYGDPLYRKNKAIVRRRSGGRCEVFEAGRPCGSRDRVQCDHIIPRSQGGTHNLENLRDACHAHHSKKTAQEGGGYRRNGRGRGEVDPPATPRTRW
jgi:5-methylcytosine-specific restriction endonuclease McrA